MSRRGRGGYHGGHRNQYNNRNTQPRGYVDNDGVYYPTDDSYRPDPHTRQGSAPAMNQQQYYYNSYSQGLDPNALPFDPGARSRPGSRGGQSSRSQGGYHRQSPVDSMLGATAVTGPETNGYSGQRSGLPKYKPRRGNYRGRYNNVSQNQHKNSPRNATEDLSKSNYTVSVVDREENKDIPRFDSQETRSRGQKKQYAYKKTVRPKQDVQGAEGGVEEPNEEVATVEGTRDVTAQAGRTRGGRGGVQARGRPGRRGGYGRGGRRTPAGSTTENDETQRGGLVISNLISQTIATIGRFVQTLTNSYISVCRSSDRRTDVQHL